MKPSSVISHGLSLGGLPHLSGIGNRTDTNALSAVSQYNFDPSAYLPSDFGNSNTGTDLWNRPNFTELGGDVNSNFSTQPEISVIPTPTVRVPCANSERSLPTQASSVYANSAGASIIRQSAPSRTASPSNSEDGDFHDAVEYQAQTPRHTPASSVVSLAQSGTNAPYNGLTDLVPAYSGTSDLVPVSGITKALSLLPTTPMPPFQKSTASTAATGATGATFAETSGRHTGASSGFDHDQSQGGYSHFDPRSLKRYIPDAVGRSVRTGAGLLGNMTARASAFNRTIPSDLRSRTSKWTDLARDTAGNVFSKLHSAAGKPKSIVSDCKREQRFRKMRNTAASKLGRPSDWASNARSKFDDAFSRSRVRTSEISGGSTRQKSWIPSGYTVPEFQSLASAVGGRVGGAVDRLSKAAPSRSRFSGWTGGWGKSRDERTVNKWLGEQTRGLRSVGGTALNNMLDSAASGTGGTGGGFTRWGKGLKNFGRGG